MLPIIPPAIAGTFPMMLPTYPQGNCRLASEGSLLPDDRVERNQARAAEACANEARLDDARYPAYTRASTRPSVEELDDQIPCD